MFTLEITRVEALLCFTIDSHRCIKNALIILKERFICIYVYETQQTNSLFYHVSQFKNRTNGCYFLLYQKKWNPLELDKNMQLS